MTEPYQALVDLERIVTAALELLDLTVTWRYLSRVDLDRIVTMLALDGLRRW